jgi:hypothetical protein
MLTSNSKLMKLQKRAEQIPILISIFHFYAYRNE